MYKKIFAMLTVFALLGSSSAFAADGWGHGRYDDRGKYKKSRAAQHRHFDSRYERVVIHGITYLYRNGVFYRLTPRGYQVCRPEVIVLR